MTNAISTTGVTNPAPQSVYQHNRYGNFTYTVPGLTAGASYNVRLDFAEEYWTAAGSRTFNVLINGSQVLTSFDIFATAGGEYKAVAESFTATASSAGAVTIQFVTVKDNAQVNGIEISPVGGTANTVTVTSPGNQATTVGDRGQRAGQRERLRVRADPHLLRDRAARGPVHQLRDRADHRHPDRGGHLDGHRDRYRHHRRRRHRDLHLDR